MKHIIPIFVLSSLICISCTKDEGSNHPPQADFSYTDLIDRFRLTSRSDDPDGDVLTQQWTISPASVVPDDNDDVSVIIHLPDASEPTEITVGLKVCDGLLCDSVSRDMELPAMTEARKWGLGRELEYELSNNTAYEWYMDQMNTGPFSGINCGPTVVTMAIKWVDQAFDETPEDARNTYRPEGGWWYTSDIINYLNLYDVNNYTIGIPHCDSLAAELEDGNIFILCLDMYYLSLSLADEWHVDKFYAANTVDWGHFILIKGYKRVDDKILYETYDPYSFGDCYADQTLKGRDRYYRSEELDVATNIWWDYAIVVSPNEVKGSKGVKTEEIGHNYGI
ncbi:MAG: hypothetical protein PVF73_00320 [Bacteroidales bacterium]